MSSEKSFDNDALLIAQLRSNDHSFMSPKSMAAIRDLAENEQGSLIFLFLSMSQRIKNLEDVVESLTGVKGKTVN